jgi:hypothetical protein
MIEGVRRNPSTVVVLAGQPSERVLAALGRSLNVVLVRPESPPDAPKAASGGTGVKAAAGVNAFAGVEAAAGALRRAAGISASYVVVAADPLAGVAAAWQEMWSVTSEAHGSDEFELRAAEALASWRSGRFELPDYYLVLAEETPPGEQPADFYLGPLRAVRPNRVSVAAGGSPEAQAEALLSELGSLRHGPWWPPLEEVFGTARGFYPGALAESPTAGQATLLN